MALSDDIWALHKNSGKILIDIREPYLMGKNLLKKLEKLGAIVPLKSGEKGVRVSLQYQPTLTEVSRSDRRNTLLAVFEHISRSIKALGAEVDLNSLSVSGQIVEAILPINHYDELEKELSRLQVRIDILTDRQIV